MSNSYKKNCKCQTLSKLSSVFTSVSKFSLSYTIRKSLLCKGYIKQPSLYCLTSKRLPFPNVFIILSERKVLYCLVHTQAITRLSFSSTCYDNNFNFSSCAYLQLSTFLFFTTLSVFVVIFLAYLCFKGSPCIMFTVLKTAQSITLLF